MHEVAYRSDNRTCSAALNLSRVPATARPTGEVKEYATSKSHSLRARNSTNTRRHPRTKPRCRTLQRHNCCICAEHPASKAQPNQGATTATGQGTYLSACTWAATIASGGCSGLIASRGSQLSGSPTTLDNTQGSL